jgi:CIC family chloride channel protein
VHGIERLLRGAVESRDLNLLILALPPVGILLSVLFVRRVAKADLAHGVSKVLAAISRRGGRLPSRMIWAPLLGCTLTVGFGGSMGMEAPIMHAGSAIGSAVGRFLGLDYRHRVLLVGCGAAAAVAAIFKAPVAGALFAVEILMIDLTAQVAIPLLVSSVTGAFLAKIITGQEIEFSFAIFQPFDYRNTFFYGLLGALSGLAAAYVRSIQAGIGGLLRRIEGPYRRALAGGLALIPLLLIFPPLFGEGYSGMTSLLSGGAADLLSNSPLYGMADDGWAFVAYLAILVLAKGAAAALTGAAGGVGGIFAPSLLMGGLTGFCLARGLKLVGFSFASEMNFALVGMAGILSALLKAPLTSVFLIAEITGGYALLVPLIITSGIAYVVGRRFSPYSIYAEELGKRNELVTHDKAHAALMLLSTDTLLEEDYVALPPEASVAELAEVALRTRRAVLPVVDGEGLLLGILRLDDLRRVLMTPSETADLCVSDFASAPQAVLGPGMGMEATLDLFERTGADELAYVGADGRFLGFISRVRALEAYRAKLAELFEERR